MKKITSKKLLILYGCSGLGLNMINMIVGSYLCSALLIGGFVDNVENWTYLNRDLVVGALWAFILFAAKAIDGIIDIPFAAMIDNIRTKFGRRRPAILGGLIITDLLYVLFLIPLSQTNLVANTVWFGILIALYYSAYTLTMLTYYATFSEIIDNEKDRGFLSTVKSVCDVVYMSLSFALVPVFVNMGLNIRIVALIFLPLTLTMLIPLFLIKESSNLKKDAADSTKARPVSLTKSLAFSFKNKKYIYWLCILFVMNVGLQLFLSGINEFFSTTGINMTFVMASAFAPVPFTLIIYNKLIKKKGLKFAYQYALAVYSLGMALMFLCRNIIPENYLLPFAIFCGVLTSCGIGAFFSITYMIPSQLAAETTAQTSGENAASMYFAIQGLFEGISAGLASGIILVFLKQNGGIPLLTIIVAICCMTAFTLAFFLPKSIALLGKEKENG